MKRRMPAEDRKAEIIAALLSLVDRIGPDRLTPTNIARGRRDPGRGGRWEGRG